MEPKDRNMITYATIASLCSAGMAAGVIISEWLFQYARKEINIATDPIMMSTL